MVRHIPNDSTRQRIVTERSSTAKVEARLINVIHGLMAPDGDPATLVVMDFGFYPMKVNRRIKSAEISIRFGSAYGDRGPEIASIAPNGTYSFHDESRGVARKEEVIVQTPFGIEASMRWERSSTQTQNETGKLTGFTKRERRSLGPDDTVKWNVCENGRTLRGIPKLLRVAVLLKRVKEISAQKFLAWVQIDADISGLSLSPVQGSFLRGEKNDPIIFDPTLSPIGAIEWVQPDKLENVDLNRLVYATLDNPEFVATEDIRQDEIRERDARREARAFLGIVDQKPDDRSKKDNCESWYVELWNMELGRNAQWVPKASSRSGLDSYRFEKAASMALPSILDENLLHEYFSWVGERTSIIAIPEHEQGQEELQNSKTFCSLIARKSAKNGLKTSEELAELLGQPSSESIFDVFDLPQDYALLRYHDHGTCEFSSKDDGKILKGYILQTPFYGSGFWSLILYSVMDSDKPNSPSRTSGVFHADKDVDFSQVFSGIHKLGSRHGRHPILLPLQLFILHCKMTSRLCKSTIADITDVDSKLLSELDNKSNPDDANKLYRNLSTTLHKSSMQLAELNRRRKFEEELGERVKQELQYGGELKLLASMFASMSKSQEADIEGLPDKIESQRNVLYSLIAQRDSYLQALLARESLHDAKAMKTLAVLTIVFLPGAFVATLFSTNKFVFQSNVQEIWIYFVIVVPFTLLLMVSWLFWIKELP
ncbi:hypothetical protein F5Y19DRAFT_427791 [Xylariaceae sp. FL1651]|nr:hypothetical protein F5Y19DRAFT_427791 [Xylariaceae sp. FL1651]